jgi:hypothetical protein
VAAQHAEGDRRDGTRRAGQVLVSQGGVLVDTTGWQGLFWIDAAIAVACVPVTLRSVKESRDPDRPRSIDLAGTVLAAGLSRAAVPLAIMSALGVTLVLLVARHRAKPVRAVDRAAAAAVISPTIPTRPVPGS